MGEAGRVLRVAVVAVHGIADQAPGSSARAILGHLLRIRRPDRSAGWSAGIGEPVAIAVEPLRPTAVEGLPPDQAFSAAALSADRPASVWHTERFAARRLGEPGDPPVEVQIHELYWADLSRVSESPVRLLTELYHLITHLPSLGALAIADATDGGTPPIPGLVRAAWAGACRATSSLLPALNLVLFGLMLAMFPPLLLEARASIAWAAAVVGVGIAAAAATGLYRSAGAKQLNWLVAPALALLAALAAVALLPTDGRLAEGLVATAVGGGAIGAALWAGGGAGSTRARMAIGGASAIAFLVVALCNALPIGPTLLQGLAYAVHGLNQLLLLGWTVTWGLTVLGAAGLWRWARPRREARQAALTAIGALCAAQLAFVVLTVTLLGVVAWALAGAAPDPTVAVAVSDPTRVPVALGSGAYLPLSQVVLQVLLHDHAAPVAGLATVAAIGVGLAALVVVPGVFRDLSPAADPGRESARRHGTWLSQGRHAMYVAGAAIALASPVLPLLFVLWGGAELPNSHVLERWFLLLPAGLAGLALALTNVGRIARVLRPILDGVLDVDRYFDEAGPLGSPRARMFDRYAALLGTLTAGAEPADTIVIVAHSQGTVITADLLRLARSGSVEAGPRGTPIHLFTMGSPLRQLYAPRFPQHYRWAVEDGPGDVTGPLPERLGVASWSHAYRSGDYVGRHLWQIGPSEPSWIVPDALPVRWGAPSTRRSAPFPATAVPGRSECHQLLIGGGGHTHYWDEAAPAVAVELDRLIGEAARRCGRGEPD